MHRSNRGTLMILMAALLVTFSSCEAIAGIFKAGVWFGVIGLIVIVAIIFWLINKARK